MGKFLRTILIGVGLGLLIAPMPGKELRRILSERFQRMQGSSSGNEPADRYQQVVAGQMTEAESNLKDIAETALNTPGKGGLFSKPFQPAYPEYVKPEQD